MAVIEPTPVFKENLALMAATGSIDGIARIELRDGSGAVVATIENAPGKQGSLDATAAEHGLAVFAEHTADARNRPGAHPNVDRLLAVIAGGGALTIDEIAA